MNPLYSEFKRKFSISMYKNMQILLGEMNFLKDFVNDTRGDLYPVFEKSADAKESVGENRYRVENGSVERVFCQFFPFATYEIEAETVSGEVGFVFRLPNAAASLTVVETVRFSSFLINAASIPKSSACPQILPKALRGSLPAAPDFSIFITESTEAPYTSQP